MTSSAPEPADAEVAAYFTAIASYDPDLLADARLSAQPGSNADQYAGYLEAFSTAAVEGGRQIESAEAEAVDGGFKGCGGTGDPTSCVTWGDIEIVDGALVDFTVDGQSFDGRLVAGDGSTTDAEDVATVEFLYAYKSPQSGTQFVVVQVVAGQAPVRIAGDRATYRGPDGSSRLSAGAWGANSVEPGGSATVVLPFEDAPAMGTADLPLFGDVEAPPVVVEIDTSA